MEHLTATRKENEGDTEGAVKIATVSDFEDKHIIPFVCYAAHAATITGFG